MAIDTENERRSVLTVYGLRIYPVADGAIGVADRQHVGRAFRGILVGAAPTGVPWAAFFLRRIEED